MLVPSMWVLVKPIRGYPQEICLLVQRTSALVHNDSDRSDEMRHWNTLFADSFRRVAAWFLEFPRWNIRIASSSGDSIDWSASTMHCGTA